MHRIVSIATYTVTTAVGIAAFLYPFWLPEVVNAPNATQAHAGDSALILTMLVGICFVVLLLEAQREAVSAKAIALLGVLVALNATLRFVEVAVPGPGGFSPIFPLIVVAGYVFGGGFGFLMGGLTLLVSALVTGSVGPWLPYQMFTAGWIGLSAPLCRPVVRMLGGNHERTEVWVLAVFGGYWGLLYGAIMNIWFWPYAVGSAQMYWEPGAGIGATLQRYAVFYAVTSLLWDLARLAGNFALIAVTGGAVLRVLRRFRNRFAFNYQPGAHEAKAEPSRLVTG
ncbi:MAG: ECF transporter S component [Caldilineaceae bacterium]|nr:ECF transporter S component [Caldilineaceae bacterium]